MKPALLAAAATLLSAAPAEAQTNAQFAATTLSLSATGETAAVPDLATLSLGVSAQASTAAEALRRDSQAMTQVLDALRQQGAKDRDIQTSGLNVQAQYAFAEGQRQRLTGYQAANRVTVTVPDLAKLGPLVDAAAAAGANSVDGINFTLKDGKAAQDEARLEAIKALTARAELYAKATGYRVARLVSLSEGERINPAFNGLEEVVVTAVRKGAPTPISGGEITVRVQVNAVYELVR